MALNIVMKHIIQSCFKPRSDHPAINESTTQDSTRLPPSGNQQRLSVGDISDPDSSLSANDLSSNSIIGSNLHIFTLSELRVITSDFSAANFLGQGGFGRVHKGFIDDKTRPGFPAQPVAVKRLDLQGTQGHKEWLVEVIILAQLKHPHLVKLIGYCWEDDDRLLVYEYMARGSLENYLFRRHSTCLPWLTRIKVAVGAAKGLAFLHGQEKPVIYRDFKASNILLDSAYNAKLSDFGLAKDGPEGDATHVTTRIMGTQGYVAPEYLMTGHLTSMSDMYSFGVVLLELVTGRRVVDKKRPKRESNMVEWAKPFLKNLHKLDRIIDPRLEGQYSLEGVKKVAALAYQCLSHHPKSRPTMNNVLKGLEGVLEVHDIPIGPLVSVVSSESQNEPGSEKTSNEDEEAEEEK